MRPGRHGTSIFLVWLLSLALAACGSGDGSPDESPTPAPTATPAFTVGPLATVAAMPLAERGFATSVNRDGWIAYRLDEPASEPPSRTGITWAPDGAQPAVPLPPLPCSALPPEACLRQFDIVLEVGDDGWLLGERVVFGSGIVFPPMPALFGPARQAVLLFDPADPGLDLDVVGFDAHLCAAAQVAAALTVREEEGGSPIRRPALWPAPGQPAVVLPSGPSGGAAASCDRALRVAGVADAPSRAVVWLPDPETGHQQVVLPLDGADESAALAIDVAQVVGWRRDGERSTPVAWIETADGFVASALPDLPGVRCDRATATSGTRIAGDCGTLGVAWVRAADGNGWRAAAELRPLPGDAQARVVAMSSDLAVGWSGDGGDDPGKRPVAWRLP